MRQLILILLFINAVSIAQTTIDCDKYLSKIPFFVRNPPPIPEDSLNFDISIIAQCGQLDSVDREIFKGPQLSMVMIKFPGNGKSVTYRSILASINSFKQTEQYEGIREAAAISMALKNKTADINNWETDKQLFVKLGAGESDLQQFKDFLSKQTTPMTYAQAMEKFGQSRYGGAPELPEIVKFDELQDLETALKAGKESKKKVLIYFTAYADANSQKMNETVFRDEKVKSLLTKNYLYYMAHVDSKQRNGTEKITLGQKHLQLQTKKFKSEVQPFFVIVNKKGKVVSSINYSQTAEFISFLENGLK